VPSSARCPTSVPGQKVQLTVTPVTFNNNGVPVRAKTVHKTVRLGKPPAGGAASGCPGLHGPSPVYLGVEIETQQDFTYPFPTSIDTAQIGGPSAGLAMTLGLLDKLTSGSLTGAKRSRPPAPSTRRGNVGDVGGVAQKTVAVENAGARGLLRPARRAGRRQVQGQRLAPYLRRIDPGPGAHHPGGVSAATCHRSHRRRPLRPKRPERGRQDRAAEPSPAARQVVVSLHA